MTQNQTWLALASPGEWADVTLGELLEQYCAAQDWARKTAAVRRSQRAAIGRVLIGGRSALSLQLAELGPVEVQHIVDTVKAGLRGKPAPMMSCRVREIINLAWIWGAKPNRKLIPVGAMNPCADVESPRPRADVPEINAEIMRAMWDATFAVEEHPQILAFIQSIMLDGLRPWSEALPMECSQLFRSGSRWAVRLTKHKTVKKSGAKVRSLGRRAAEILLAQREAVGGRGPLWPSIGTDQGSGHMSVEAVKRVFRLVVAKASESIDIDPRTYVYCARHGFATSSLEAGATLVEVQAALGHDHVQSTLRYLHMVPGREGETADRMATLVIDGEGATLDDLAREIGCESNIQSMIAEVRRVSDLMGVRKLSEATESMTSTRSQPLTEWNHERFQAACREKGITRPVDLWQAVNRYRKAIATETGQKLVEIDRRSATRYYLGERGHSPKICVAVELANVVGKSLDWLCTRDEYVAGSQQGAVQC